MATRTVNIGYRYLDRVDPDAFLRRQYTPDGATQDTPEADINTRIKGEERMGSRLTTPTSLRTASTIERKG